jgi:hypothetical protein
LGAAICALEVERVPTSHAHLLLELLVDGIKRIFDSDTLEVASCDFEAEGEVKVNLLDWWGGEHLFESFLVINCGRRRV